MIPERIGFAAVWLGVVLVVAMLLGMARFPNGPRRPRPSGVDWQALGRRADAVPQRDQRSDFERWATRKPNN